MYLPLSLLVACSTSVDLDPDTDTGKGGTPEATPCEASLDHAVSTSSGCVTGKELGDGEAFLGIPFAAPPVGELRFAPPEPVEPWSEPRDATEYGPICIQQDGVAADLAGVEQSEDCLTLNIWRPADAEALPVIVFIHGGSHVAGSGRFAYPDQPRLAEDAILVTLQYRLGALGFLAQAALTTEATEGASGNQALKDNLLALDWVNENAAAFGGDPDQVTLWGFSAGATSTCALLESPLAAGLLDRVVIESGLCGMMEQAVHSENEFERDGEQTGEAFALAAGCAGDDATQLACLRDLSAEELLAAQVASPDLSFGILRDGYVLPDHGMALLESGDFNRVPILAGNVSDERRPEAEALGLDSEEALAGALRSEGTMWGIEDLDGLVALYDVATYGSESAAMSAFLSDAQYVCPTRVLLASTSDWVDGRGWWFSRLSPTSASGVVSHGADMSYWFHNGAFTDETDEALGTTMSAALIAFAQGEPTVDGIGDWPLNGGMAGEDSWVAFGDEVALESEVHRDACEWLLLNGLSL